VVLLGAVCAAFAFTAPPRWPSVVALVFAGIAAVAERYAFFAASCAPRMPGGAGK